MSISILITVGFFLREFISNFYVRFTLNQIQIPERNTKLLVFAPHNDDEVLGAGNLIKKTLENGGKVKVVLVTNGDGFKSGLELDYFKLNPKPQDYIKFGYKRQQETIEALKTLGLSKDNIVFLGYPDGGIMSMWETNWENSQPYKSIYTKTNFSPYVNSMTIGAPYAGESLLSNIKTIVSEFKPDYVVYPHPNDRHPDHWATNAFVKLALTELNYKPKKQWLYLVHRGDWPTPLREDLRMYLTPPAKLLGTGTEWQALDMTLKDIKDKSKAIHLYKTQLRTLSLLITAFERKNELFGEYPDGKLRSGLLSDANLMPTDSNRIIIDPFKDTLGLQLSKETDITGVYAEISTENNLNIFVTARSKIENLTRYHVNLTFLCNSKLKRMNLEIQGSKIINSINTNINNSWVSVRNENGRLRIIIPHSSTGDFNHLLISVQSSIGERIFDRTASKMCSLS
ncbi:MAG: PIG-L family deacetylase [Clostridiales bacterium]|nr:PIG-L family deacetylase [Clostridiales bacterium]